jgi:predicted MFS family arabinose efflux permease
MASPSLRLFLIFFILSVLWVLSMFYRVSNAVIATNLIQDLGLDPETLGILGGAYFCSLALLQIPMGPMLDRIGPRILVTFFPLIGALGAFLFAFGESFTIALFGRILIGVGMAPVFMGALKVFTFEFPPEKFATLVGIILSIGTLGNIFAGSPLAYLNTTIGWRMTFVLAGGITIVLAILVFWVLGGKKDRDEKTQLSFASEPKIGIFQSIRLILGSLAFWQIGSVAFFSYGTFVGLLGLWLGPYLMEIKGYSSIQTGNLLIMCAIGVIVGGPISGRISDRHFDSRKTVVLFGLTLYSLSLLPLIGILEIRNIIWNGFIFFSIGFFNAFSLVIYSHAKELFHITISGTITAWISFFFMAGGAIFMPAIGNIIESFPCTEHGYPAKAYHLSFLVCILGMAASLVFYAFSKERSRT